VSSPKPPSLPEFERPPVIEVALGVQFDPIAALNSARIVEFWADRLRDRFPTADELQPIAPAVEWFGAPFPMQFAFQFGARAASTRWLFADGAQNELVQIQQDRFVRNWRQIAEGDKYPRYPPLKQKFREDFELFEGFLTERGLPAPVPNQCEVTYVNHVDLTPGQTSGEPQQYLSPWSGKYSDGFLPVPESVEVAARYPILRGGEPVGRLHITSSPVQSVQTGSWLFLLTLTARGRPATRDVEGVLDFLDLGREHVVRGFASVTTPDAHKTWGRRRDGITS
jgi:uncharacterized protein (TIGR04255 family)